ncbi:GerAB/ArcD/ProY family transporter [Cytobacillus sp. Hm23]
MKEGLSTFQVAIMVFMIQTGIDQLSLPRYTAEAFGTNGWIGILIFSVLVILNLILIALVFRFGKDKTIFEILEDVISPILVKPLYVFLALLWSTTGVLVLKYYDLLLRTLYYPTMPSLLFIIFTLVITYWLVRSGIYHIGKTTVVFFGLTIWIVLLFFYLTPEFRILRFTPFIFEGEKKIIDGGFGVLDAFLGYELVILIIPFMMKKKSAFKALIFGNIITTFIFLVNCFVAYGYFSYDQLVNDTYPFITMIEYFQLPFFQRLDGFIVSLYFLRVLITIVVYYWSADLVLRHAVPSIKPRYTLLFLIILTFCLSFIPNLSRELDEWDIWLGLIEGVVSIALPVFLLLLLSISHVIKKRKGVS